METAFPFGFPFATGFYLFWYVLTLIIHVVFMNYVLAGSGYLAVGSLLVRKPINDPQRQPTLYLLRDWLPFALSAAITAGVAPLLFVQILYKENFYTANLLLLHRWMIILPVLIVGFYLLYLFKSAFCDRSWLLRTACGLSAFACFAFVAWSWSENYLLSQNPGDWATFYATKQTLYRQAEVWPRLLVWSVGAVPTMAVMVGWQTRSLSRKLTADCGDATPISSGRTALLALVGIGLTMLAGAFYAYAAGRDGLWSLLTGRLAGWYFGIAVAGVLLQVVAWVQLYRARRFCGGYLSLASVGVLLTVAGMTVVREAIRITNLDLLHNERLLAQHASAVKVGGIVVFLIFFVLNAGLIAYAVSFGARAKAKDISTQPA